MQTVETESIEKALANLHERKGKEIFGQIPNMGTHVAEVDFHVALSGKCPDAFFLIGKRITYRNSSIDNEGNAVYAYGKDGVHIPDFDYNVCDPQFYKELNYVG